MRSCAPIYFEIFFKYFLLIGKKHFSCNTQKVVCNTLQVYLGLNGFLGPQSKGRDTRLYNKFISLSKHYACELS